MHIVECDLSDMEAVKGVVGKALKVMERGEVDVLVNCAGVQRRARAVEFGEGEWDEVRVFECCGLSGGLMGGDVFVFSLACFGSWIFDCDELATRRYDRSTSTPTTTRWNGCLVPARSSPLDTPSANSIPIPTQRSPGLYSPSSSLLPIFIHSTISIPRLYSLAPSLILIAMLRFSTIDRDDLQRDASVQLGSLDIGVDPDVNIDTVGTAGYPTPCAIL